METSEGQFIKGGFENGSRWGNTVQGPPKKKSPSFIVGSCNRFSQKAIFQGCADHPFEPSWRNRRAVLSRRFPLCGMGWIFILKRDPFPFRCKRVMFPLIVLNILGDVTIQVNQVSKKSRIKIPPDISGLWRPAIHSTAQMLLQVAPFSGFQFFGTKFLQVAQIADGVLEKSEVTAQNLDLLLGGRWRALSAFFWG